MFKALESDTIILNLINENNLDEVIDLFQGFEDSEIMITEIYENFIPRYEGSERVNFGFYATLNNQLAGLSLLSIDDLKEAKGSTGADTMLHMRGKGLAPRSKPHLFYLAFEILGLNRLETGCLVSNISSKRSIEKTSGFQFEGVARESGLNERGAYEDQYIYSILKRDWLKLYDKNLVKVIY